MGFTSGFDVRKDRAACDSLGFELIHACCILVSSVQGLQAGKVLKFVDWGLEVEGFRVSGRCCNLALVGLGAGCCRILLGSTQVSGFS